MCVDWFSFELGGRGEEGGGCYMNTLLWVDFDFFFFSFLYLSGSDI